MTEHSFDKVSETIAAHRGGAHSLVRKLDDGGMTHLSWSKVACVESCRQSYYLQYVKRVKLTPEPDYFVKGRLFHRAAEKFYKGLRKGAAPASADLALIFERHHSIVARGHIANAVEVMVANAFHGWEVLGVEKVFALDLGPKLPPAVGVIDLVLKKGKVFAVVDHKTGKDFWRQDPMQLAIYREHVVRAHGAEKVAAYFDAYRWVNSLTRIRKPAHVRTRVRLTSRSWGAAQRRFEAGYEAMQEVEKAGEKSPGGGPCWMCSLRGVCKKVVYTSWW